MSTTWSPPLELSPREQKLCRKLEKHRRFYRFLRMQRHALFADGFEAELCSLYSDTPRGTPPKPPALLTLVVLLQAYARASDDDAVQLAESDARWQMVLDCLGAEDAPFGKSTLVDFRARLVRSRFYDVLLRRTADLARQSGEFDPKALKALRVAVDSLPLDGVGRREDTLNLLARALRLLVTAVAATLVLPVTEVYAAAGLTILAAPSPKTGLDRDWDQPGAEDAALNELVQELERVQRWMAAQPPATRLQAAVVRAQRQVQQLLEQDTEVRPTGGRRIKAEVAPDRQLSLFDPEMRHGRKSKSERIDGYKVYLAVDLDAELTLATGTLPANAPEARGADKLRSAVDACGTVAELHIDRAFLSSDWAQALARGDLDAVTCRGPAHRDTGYFSKYDFALAADERTLTCPAGQSAPVLQDEDTRRVRFGAATCRDCPQRGQCQNTKHPPGRTLTLVKQETLLRKSARVASTPEGRARLRERVKVEHANARQVSRYGRTARYQGVAKNDFDAARIAAVGNLQAADRRLRGANATPPKPQCQGEFQPT